MRSARRRGSVEGQWRRILGRVFGRAVACLERVFMQASSELHPGFFAPACAAFACCCWRAAPFTGPSCARFQTGRLIHNIEITP